MVLRCRSRAHVPEKGGSVVLLALELLALEVVALGLPVLGLLLGLIVLGLVTFVLAWARAKVFAKWSAEVGTAAIPDADPKAGSGVSAKHSAKESPNEKKTACIKTACNFIESVY